MTIRIGSVKLGDVIQFRIKPMMTLFGDVKLGTPYNT